VSGEPNSWLAIPLSEYESYMSDALQLAALSQLFGEALERCRPKSVAVLGVAGGNGLERIDPLVTTRVVALDVNLSYLRAARNRHGHLPGLELHQVDLSSDTIALPPVEMVHAALIFEHAGVDRCLQNALALVSPGGHLSVVLQTCFRGQDRGRGAARAEIGGWPVEFRLIDVERFRAGVEERGLTLTHEGKYPVLDGEFWAAIFESNACR